MFIIPTKNEIRELHKSYVNGKTLEELCLEIGCSISYLSKRFKREGYPDKSRRKEGGLNKSDFEELHKQYLNGKSIRKLSKENNIQEFSISRKFRELGLKIKTLSEARAVYKLNHDAFIDVTPNSAYWIGFLMADGCINYRKDSNTVAINLQLAIKDYEHLVKFKSFMEAENPISRSWQNTNFGSFECCRFSFCSHRVANNLADYGVKPRKTFDAKISLLENNRDFWRGMVDGDGSLVRSTHISLVLFGSLEITKAFAKYCNKMVGCKISHRPEKGIFRAALCGGSARAVSELLYKDAETYLDRKMAIAKTFHEAKAGE